VPLKYPLELKESSESFEKHKTIVSDKIRLKRPLRRRINFE
jgi:hypothetical protein